MAIEGLSVFLPSTQLQIIDQPYQISTTGGLQLYSSLLQSMSSWAKVRQDLYADGWVSWELIFSYFWQNSAQPVVINAGVPIILNGAAWALARTIGEDPPPPGSESQAHLTLSIELETFDVTNMQEYEGVSSPTWVAADLRASNTQGPGYGVSQNVFRGFYLTVEDLFVEPGDGKVFDVFLKISAFIHNAGIGVDFSSDAFQVTSPWALLKISTIELQRSGD